MLLRLKKHKKCAIIIKKYIYGGISYGFGEKGKGQAACAGGVL